MNTLINNTEVMLNICEFLIQPSILVLDHYYTSNNKLKLIIDTEYSKSQTKDYICYLKSLINYKYQIFMLDSNQLFLKLINEINYMNNCWIKTGHSIYFSRQYLVKQWKKSHVYKLNNNSFNYYTKTFYKYIQLQKLNYTISKYYNLNIFHLINQIEKNIQRFEMKVKISELQFIMKYWSLYFSDYLEIINHDLSKLKASELIDYINIEEMLLHELVDA